MHTECTYLHIKYYIKLFPNRLFVMAKKNKNIRHSSDGGKLKSL